MGDIFSLAEYLVDIVEDFEEYVREFMADKLLDLSYRNVPVLSGNLQGSGQAWIGGVLYDQIGEGTNVKHFELSSDPNSVVVTYSFSKEVGPLGKEYYFFAGRKWFDYSKINEMKAGASWAGPDRIDYDSLLQEAVMYAINKLM